MYLNNISNLKYNLKFQVSNSLSLNLVFKFFLLIRQYLESSQLDICRWLGSFFLFSCEHPDKVFQHFSLRINANVQPINPKRNVKQIGRFTPGVSMQSFVIHNIVGDDGRNEL